MPERVNILKVRALSQQSAFVSRSVLLKPTKDMISVQMGDKNGVDFAGLHGGFGKLELCILSCVE